MKKILLVCLGMVLMPSLAAAADAHVTKTTLACENIGWIAMMEQYHAEGDEAAVKRLKAQGLQSGKCQMFKKGTHVFFHHLVYYTDGDYGSHVEVRRAGETSSWIIEKCALDSRDPDAARFPAYTVPEEPCAEPSQP